MNNAYDKLLAKEAQEWFAAYDHMCSGRSNHKIQELIDECQTKEDLWNIIDKNLELTKSGKTDELLLYYYGD